MVKRGDDLVVLWPRYFDRRVSRADGRRVPSDKAVREPDVKWIASAAKKAGLDPTVEDDVKDPFVPFKTVGRVIVPKTESKEAIIRKVVAQMQE